MHMTEEKKDKEEVQKEEKTSKSGEKPYNFDANVEAAFSYLVGFITGGIVYYYEKENKFVRFHAMQSVIFSILYVGVWAVVSAIPFLGLILSPLIAIAGFIIWLALMWKAYNNEEWELPFIGKIAKEQANK